MKYRKKPIIIEAYQTDVELDIETLEGIMHASIGDYIITGVNGERYPCKPDIFEKTYELVKENNCEMSKELRALEVSNQLKDFVLEFVKNGLDRRFVRGSFDIIEKELKALEIIKVVCPNVFWVMRTYTYEEYKKKCPDDTLLQEEYDLLKEVLL